ncbi:MULTISPECIES: hypothetical protein [unclassified Pseudomonas]|jgi:hypothetical protein|uniref:TniQ family protein n=1 Tax=Pseudomonas sp. MYb327 TaxID=2745230 RepID=A0AAU8DY34_9PSED
MKKICYVAKPQNWESPKGVIMRTALHNGYGNVALMCKSLQVPCSGDGLDLLTEQSPIIKILTIAAPEIEQPLIENTYSVKNIEASLWIIDEIFVYRSFFSHHFVYCPKCLRDELITVFQDIRSLTICPFHQTRIITKCPNCHQTEHWTTANLLFCKCGSDRRKSTYQKGALFNEKNIETFGPNTYIPRLSRLTDIALLCENIWNSRMPAEEKKTYSFLDEVRKYASKMIATQLKKYPGFTCSMHLSPWAYSRPLLAEIAHSMIDKKIECNKICHIGQCCTEVNFTINQIMYSMNDWKTWQKERSFLHKNFQIVPHVTGMRFYHSYIPICHLIRLLRDAL